MSAPRTGPNRPLATALLAMVLLPVGVFAVAGQQLVRDQEALSRIEASRIFDDRLDTLESAVQTILRGIERELGRYAETLPSEPAELAEALRRLPRQVDVLVLGADGRLLHPSPRHSMTRRESALLDRTRRLWQRGALWTLARGGALAGVGPSDDRGWLTPFQHATHTFFRWNRAGSRTVFFEIGEVALAGELVMQLPDTPEEADRAGKTRPSRTVLVDASGSALYQWGRYEPAPDEEARATRALMQPLTGWRLVHFAPESELSAAYEGTLRVAVWGGVAVLALILGGFAWLIWRARTEESRVAQRRLSFVNQVSHELKTPLTNIRMYADLLAEAIEDEDIDGLGQRDPKQRHLAVIVRESDRLSRLIRNVLNFARSQEERLTLSPRPGRLGAVVAAAVDNHRESLKTHGIEVEIDAGDDRERLIDGDAVEQILGNLISNAEKYARSGGYLGIEVQRAAAPAEPEVRIRVRDRGPGIPREQRERVFEPFWRASDKLSDGVAGTGIGLDIARRLARLHGGDLRLVPVEGPGSLFEVTLRAPLTTDRPEGT